MNDKIIFFATGCLIGGLGAGVVLKLHYDKKISETINETIDECSVKFKQAWEENVEANKVKASDLYYCPDNEPKEEKMMDAQGLEHKQTEEGLDYVVDENGKEVETETEDENLDWDCDNFTSPKISEEEAFLKEENYVSKEEMYTTNKPYSISPDEYEEFLQSGYDTVSWTIYNSRNGSKVMANELYELVTVDELKDSVGLDVYNCIGEYEPDTALICNNRLNCIIDVTVDNTNYVDVLKAMPFLNKQTEPIQFDLITQELQKR